ncbi:DUF2723 domain-containing protein [Candidatus Beckwithbacteria bacterium]|nr:DUF2723 domain-containing protein [Candidatus Beckwithbacteria bacterium]
MKTKTKKTKSNKIKQVSNKKTIAKKIIRKNISQNKKINSTKTKKPSVEIRVEALLPNMAWLGTVAVGLGFFILYILTAPRTNVSYADSDELLAVAYHFGVAHPPGYPLYTLLLHFFTNLPIPGSVAFRGSVLTALLTASTMSILFLVLWRSIAYLQANIFTKNTIFSTLWDRVLLSFLPVAMLGSSFLIWLYGVVPEKYAFGNFLISIFLLSAVSIFTLAQNKKTQIWWIILGGSFGLSLAHHQLSILLLPSIITLLIFVKKNLSIKKISWVLIPFLATLLVSAGILWWQNSHSAIVSWRFEQSLSGLLGHIFRQDFAGTNLSTGVQTTPYQLSVDIGQSLESLPHYIQIILSHFGLINLVMIAIGLWLSLKDLKRFGWLVLAGLVPTAILLPLYLGFTGDIGMQAVTMRLYLMGYIFLVFPLMVGWWWVLVRLRKVLTFLLKPKQGSLATITVIALASIVLLWQVQSNYRQVDLSHFNIVSRLYHQMLSNLPKDSMLACFTDTACFALLYEQSVNNVRPDVIVLPVQYPLVADKLAKYPNLRGYGYDKNPFLLLDYITWNVGKRPVFVTDIDQTYYNFLGMHYGFLYYIPHGYYGQLVKTVPETLPKTDYQLSLDLKKAHVSSKDLMRSWIKTIFARIHNFNSVMYQKMGFRAKVRDELNIASDLLFQIPQISHNQIEASRSYVENAGPVEAFGPGESGQTVDEVLKNVDEFIKRGRLDLAYIGAYGAVAMEPLDVKARLKLASIYEQLEEYDMAALEYSNILKYHPDNKEAAQCFGQLTSEN